MGCNLLIQASEPASEAIIQCFLTSLGVLPKFAFIRLPSFHICSDDTKYCKHRDYLLLLCDIEAFQLFFKQMGSMKIKSVCYRMFWVFSGCFLIVIGFLRSFQFVSCLLQVMPSDFLLVLGRFRLCQIFRRFRRLFNMFIEHVYVYSTISLVFFIQIEHPTTSAT